jgi:hypothetical protein
MRHEMREVRQLFLHFLVPSHLFPSRGAPAREEQAYRHYGEKQGAKEEHREYFFLHVPRK